MTGARLSNYATDLADRAGAAYRRGRARTIEAAEAYLEAGNLLLELKAATPHGDFKPALKRADIPYRAAARMMQIARAGMSADALASLGVRAAAASLATARKVPPVAHSAPAPAPSATPAQRRRAIRAARRRAGNCLECGAPAAGRARCERCAAAVSERRKRRRAFAHVGEALDGRLRTAAAEGRGIRLSPAEVARIARAE